MSTTEARTAPPAPLSAEAEAGLERYQRPPILDGINQRQLALIKNQIAPKASDAEVGWFLELAAHYDLDVYAHEIWCVVSPGKDGGKGRLLVMVGRDGLRKVVQRNGLHMDCDVVREKDAFKVSRTSDGQRAVEHSYGPPASRGAIVGAWAEVRRGGPKGDPMGFFYAPLTEYMPAGVSKYSPWSKQVSVMIMAAAERQAARQATPLSGLLIEGEDESIASTAVEVAEDDLPVGFWQRIVNECDADFAEQLREATKDWPPAKIEMTFSGLPGEQLREVAESIPKPEKLDEREVQFDPETGEVLDEDVTDAEEVVAEPIEDATSDAAILRQRIDGLRVARQEAPANQHDVIDEEIEGLEMTLRLLAGENPEQGSLL